MEEVKIRELSEKSSINTTDHLVIEDADGTKKVSVKHFRSLVLSTLYFNSIKELKESSTIGLKEGDICETLGYHYPGDGGGARYEIKYDPAAVDDGKLVHNLAYSDTLRAELILGDTINVHQFGATGDGNTDDTDAIQAAIDHSGSRVVEFSNGKRYSINESIIVKKSNTIINGNGATLYPLYVDGIRITSNDTSTTVTDDVSINKLHFDCSRAVSAINVFRATKVDFSGCNIYSVSDTGINLANCSFITIDNCHLLGNGQTSSNLISINGQAFDINTPSLSCKFVDIEDTKFSNFAKAININSTGSLTEDYSIININNCRYDSSVNNAYCIYGSCPVELMTIDSNTVTRATTFLFMGGASGGSISCKDISCLNTNKVFDIGSTTCVLRLDGSMNTSTGSIVFERMIGKLYSNIMWESLTTGASFNLKPTGEISDIVNPYNYNDTKGYTITGSKLTIHEARNMHVNWTSSTNNLTEIVNGVKGQLMYLRSSTGKSITAVPNKIVLSESAIKLGTYYGVMLKYDGLKWTQISNLTTVSALNNSIVGDLMGGGGSQGGNSPSGGSGTMSGPIIIGGGTLVDKDTTYTLLKDNNEIKLVCSSGSVTSVVDEDTKYTLEDFGITATADEINKVTHGCTVTKDEINILNGAIINTQELNQLHGVTENIQVQINSKAPTNHASTTDEYGIGNREEYGHVKLSDVFIDTVGSSVDGVGASQAALHDAYTRVQTQVGDINTNIVNLTQKNVDIQNQIYTMTETGIPKLNVYQFSFTASANQTIFNIDLDTFSKITDTVFVQSGVTLLAQGNDFTVTDTGIELVSGVPAGRTVVIYIFKNVPNGEEGSVNGSVIYEGSLPIDRLERMPTPDEVGAAEAIHEHSANDITNGVLSASRGGTEASSLTGALNNLFSALSNSYFPDDYVNLPYGSSHGVYEGLKANDPFTSTTPKRVHAVRLKGNAETESVIFVTSVDGGNIGKTFIGHHDGTSVSWNEISIPGHKQAASTITAGTLAGKVLANASAVATLDTKQIRNIYAGTTEISTLAPGDIYIIYE